MWPSSDLADIALRRLETCRHPSPSRHIKYPGAGHLIVVPYWPLTVRNIGLRVEGCAGYLYSQGATAKIDAGSSVDAWANTLAFLDQAINAHG
jgi:BAAT / Acyl-CoA thioester hydrolase C terminal